MGYKMAIIRNIGKLMIDSVMRYSCMAKAPFEIPVQNFKTVVL